MGLIGVIALGGLLGARATGESAPPPEIRVGMIGLDTSHCLAFAKVLNNPGAKDDVNRCRVVAAYPKGSRDIESSVTRVPAYTKQIREMGVEIVDSIDALLKRVDVVLLESNDGKVHLEQVLPVLRAGKPVFVDKPVAGSLADAIAIYEAARHYGVPLFSSSSLRYLAGAQAARAGEMGKVVGANTFSPCALEPSHPDLFWYGIHGVEILFTVMGPGCETVTRVSTKDTDVVTGVWKDGRIGTFRGMRSGKRAFGGTVFTSKGIYPLGKHEGYGALLVEIVKFFRSGKVPVTAEETLQIYAFMEAADESKRQGGKPVAVKTVMDKAQKQASAKLKKLLTVE